MEQDNELEKQSRLNTLKQSKSVCRKKQINGSEYIFAKNKALSGEKLTVIKL